MKISKLALIALLGGALMALGCGSDSSAPAAGGTGGGDGGSGGMGGTGGIGGGTPTCDSTACLFCPEETLGTFGAIIGDINVPIDFTATPQDGVVQGETAMIALEASSEVSGLPISVEATVMDASTTTYVATAGGTGEVEVAIPEQTVMGMDLMLDGGSGTLSADVDADATELTIQITAALIDLQVTSPAPISLTLDASETGDCDMLGDGVTLTVTPAM